MSARTATALGPSPAITKRTSGRWAATQRRRGEERGVILVRRQRGDDAHERRALRARPTRGAAGPPRPSARAAATVLATCGTSMPLCTTSMRHSGTPQRTRTSAMARDTAT